MSTTTTNMDLVIPDVNNTAGPDWATLLNAALTRIDLHDHTTDLGVKVPTAGININATLEFNDHLASEVQGIAFENQASVLPTSGSTLRTLFVSDGELFYNDSAGNQIQITTNGNISAGLELPNNTYLRSVDNAGTGTVNLIRANTSDRVEFGANAANMPLAGSTSGSCTLRAADTTSSYSIKFPSAAGSANQIMKVTSVGSGIVNLDFQNDNTAGNDDYRPESANYTITDSDNARVVAVTTGSTTRTVTLPTAADNENRIITIKKVDSGTGLVTVDGEGAETIDGFSTWTLYTHGEAVEIICDGSNWQILTITDGQWADANLSIANGTNGSFTYQKYKRVGREISLIADYSFTGAGAAGNLSITASTLPAALTTPTAGTGNGDDFAIGHGYTYGLASDQMFALSVDRTGGTNSTVFINGAIAGSGATLDGDDFASGDGFKLFVRYLTSG